MDTAVLTNIKDRIFDIFKELKYGKQTLYNMLDKTDHGENCPYHQEGSILTHIEMVYKEAKLIYPLDTDLHIACLLHDVGKPFCKFFDEETNKTRFFGHESFSVYIAIDVLEKYIGRYVKNLNESPDIVRILKLIQRHADLYRFGLNKLIKLYNKNDYIDLLKLHVCDTRGKIPAREPVFYDIENFKDSFSFPKYESTAYYMIGVPNSGKSTLIKDKFKDKKYNILSRDDIITKLYPDLDYNKAFKLVDQKEVDVEFSKMFETYSKSNKDLVIDKTNIRRKTRATQIQKNKTAIVFLVGYTEIMNRNKQRTNKVLKKDIIHNFMKTLELPYSGEFKYAVYIFKGERIYDK